MIDKSASRIPLFFPRQFSDRISFETDQPDKASFANDYGGGGVAVLVGIMSGVGKFG
jgi:hypothetical protein